MPDQAQYMVMGVQHSKGKSKDTGKPYEMCTVYAMRPIETFEHKNGVMGGEGFQPWELQAEPEVIEQITKSNARFPAMVTLITEMRPARSGKGVEGRVIGLTDIKPLGPSVPAKAS